ncbi:protein STRUBBELIG-RECEPTOR FAMILY 8-like [Ananas comosus]|uniref:Protein STRUBBELIG-RECEPTOR FAMILY 8-like n=1 Tax=Ananas comosus TaxID=4615 RepID=A0A6P5GUM0_ANACO|nr:protein STRUBBELIG-RECEPTOR FAMILY 8-like [Ananas comosus]
MALAGWRIGGGDPCGGEPWIGVSCSGPSVVSINISGLGIGGFLNQQLSNLLSLKELDVSNNTIGVEIPYGLPPNVTRINLAANKFEGSIPLSLSSLKFLKHLNFSYNNLLGPIGNAFTDMQSLETLDLSFNHFTGDLPTSFGSLTHLHSLYLQGNEFTGSVILLANLPLSILNLENNHFSGYIPKQLEFTPQLRIDGNLFQQSINGSTHSPLSSTDNNVSHSPRVSQVSFSYPSKTVHNKHRKKVGIAVMVGVVGSLFVIAVISAIVFIINARRYHKNNPYWSKSSSESLCSLPITAPAEPRIHFEECIWDAPSMTGVQPPPLLHQIKSEKISTRRSSVKRSKNLVTAKLYSASEILAATKNYCSEGLIGKGLIGRVYRAEFPDGQILAVKKIDMIELTLYEEDEFLDVIWSISRLKHRHISTLLGYCVEQGQHVLVYEYAKNGSLDDVLFSPISKCKDLSWKARLRIALGVAYALEFMHCICSPPVAHGNVKATNILLDDKLMPHISDCGLTVLTHLVSAKQKAAGKLVGSKGYAAPEIATPGVDKKKSDVYSFGVVLLELLTGRRAFDSSREEEQQFLVNWASLHLHDLSSLEGITDPQIRGNIPLRALSRFADIISLCIQPLPEFRLSISEVTERLVRLVRKMGQHDRPSTADHSDPDVSNFSFRTTLPYFDPSTSPSSA